MSETDRDRETDRKTERETKRLCQGRRDYVQTNQEERVGREGECGRIVRGRERETEKERRERALAAKIVRE